MVATYRRADFKDGRSGDSLSSGMQRPISFHVGKLLFSIQLTTGLFSGSDIIHPR
jgi:hypothetical protein